MIAAINAATIRTGLMRFITHLLYPAIPGGSLHCRCSHKVKGVYVI
jgi:hypothetical protein